MRDAAVRVALGLSLERVAAWAGVHRDTLRMFEAAPEALRPSKRERCLRVYVVLRKMLAELDGLDAPESSSA